MTDTPEQQAALVGEQDRLRDALIERLGTFADLLCANPLPGAAGDVAYDLLRKSAAQISSDKLRLAALTQPRDSEALPVERMLCDLLAVVHRDGGHRTGGVGLEQAWMEAMMLVPTYLTQPRDSEAERLLRDRVKTMLKDPHLSNELYWAFERGSPISDKLVDEITAHLASQGGETT